MLKDPGREYRKSDRMRLTDHGVVFPAFEVAERRSLSFKPTDDISIDFRYMGYNAYVFLAIR